MWYSNLPTDVHIFHQQIKERQNGERMSLILPTAREKVAFANRIILLAGSGTSSPGTVTLLDMFKRTAKASNWTSVIYRLLTCFRFAHAGVTSIFIFVCSMLAEDHT